MTVTLTSEDLVYDSRVYTDYSSVIKAVYYNSKTQRLFVQVATGTYVYDYVPSQIFKEFADADSAGSYWRNNVQQVYGPSVEIVDAADLEYKPEPKPWYSPETADLSNHTHARAGAFDVGPWLVPSDTTNEITFEATYEVKEQALRAAVAHARSQPNYLTADQVIENAKVFEAYLQ